MITWFSAREHKAQALWFCWLQILTSFQINLFKSTLVSPLINLKSSLITIMNSAQWVNARLELADQSLWNENTVQILCEKQCNHSFTPVEVNKWLLFFFASLESSDYALMDSICLNIFLNSYNYIHIILILCCQPCYVHIAQLESITEKYNTGKNLRKTALL